MFPLQSFTILAFLSFSALASPLLQRDVVAPPILLPNSNSIWPIGTQQLVQWDTSGLPPTSQITNPIAQIILGYNESNSLNLDLNNPLAKGFLITAGNVTVTVPNVPPRNDYLIVLFGDSGDTSPAFAITQITSPNSGSSSSSSSSASSDSTPDAPPDAASSLSITGSVTALGLSVGTQTLTTTPSLPTATSPTGTTTTGSTGSSGTSTSTSSSAASSSAGVSSAGWSMHHGKSSVALILIPLVMLFVV